MNKYVLYIATSAFVIVFALGALRYGYWDASQPKTGPVGDGDHTPSFQDLLPIFCVLFAGLLNLPVAIMRYLQYKKTKEHDSEH